MTSKIKVDNITNQSDSNIVNKCGTTITLGASGDTINLASGASQTGFGRTGTVDWITTPKTTGTFTAVSGEGYFLNTSGGVITANLPAGVAGAIVSFADYAATWQTNNVTVVPNGTDKIGSLNENATLSVEGQSVTFVFVDSTQGWINTMDSTSNVRGAPPFMVATGGTITTSGNCKIHTFTGPGTFTVCSVAGICAPARNTVSYLVVAGGGAGGETTGGGGGAGGFREVKNPITPYTASPLDGYPTSGNRITVTDTSFPITIGAGGAGAPGTNPTNAGSNSIFSTITSAGGGGGGNYGGKVGNAGGSGGGGAGSAGGPRAGGAGNTPPTTPAQGFAGGNGASTGPCNGSGGGGGGATVVGSNAPPGSYTPGGAGGAGATTNISASPVAYAGGGGGMAYSPGPSVTGGAAGTGGGGIGGAGGPGGQEPRAGSNGTANTGGGAGGNNNSGGSGIVIIRYKFQ
jgi:hypothetical protein